MSVDDELKQILNLVLTRNEDVEKLNLFIKLKNGNVFNYKIDRVKELKVLQNIQKKQEKERLKNEKVQKKLEIKQGKQDKKKTK